MKKPFQPAASVETQFGRQLRKVARHAGHIVGVHIDGTKIIDEPEMQKALREYARILTPWAKRQAAKMLLKVNSNTARAMRVQSKVLGQGLRAVIEGNLGETAMKLMDEQVELIKSIPINAGERAQKLSMQALYEGSRASEIAAELSRTTQVSESDALRIARTETARANSTLTQARAKAVGSTHYIWRTSKDAAVRESHKKMEGKVVSWSAPPTLDDGTTGHAGTFPNCRCYPEPVFTD